MLGEDDPGRVLWAPQVFDLAADHGLILMDDGSLVDILAHETPPEGVAPMPKTTPEQVSDHQVVDLETLNEISIRNRQFNWLKNTTLSTFDGVEEAALLGPASGVESIPDGHLNWHHGFVMRALRMSPGAEIPEHTRQEEEVIFVHRGSFNVTVDGETLELEQGDTFTTPIGSKRTFSNQGTDSSIVYITRRHDQPEAPEFT